MQEHTGSGIGPATSKSPLPSGPRGPGPEPAGAAGLGDVRLGELGDGLHDHHRRVPDLLLEGRLRRVTARGGVAVGWPSRRRSAWSSSPSLSPVLGAIADYTGRKKTAARRLPGARRSARSPRCTSSTRGDWILASVLFILANIGANGSFVFYDALLPHIARDDEIDRVSTAGYALGLPRRRAPAGAQPGVDPEARMVRAPVGREPDAGAGDAARAAGLPLGRRLVVRLLDPAVPPRARAEGRVDAGGRRARQSDPGHDRAAERDRPRAPPVPPGVPDAAGLPDLQRRHRHDHPDGDDLRRPRSSIDQGAMIASILIVQFVGIPLLVPLRDAGRPDRGQAVDRARAARLHGDLRRRLLHDDGHATSWSWRSWWGWCRGGRRP